MELASPFSVHLGCALAHHRWVGNGEASVRKHRKKTHPAASSGAALAADLMGLPFHRYVLPPGTASYRCGLQTCSD